MSRDFVALGEMVARVSDIYAVRNTIARDDDLALERKWFRHLPRPN